MTAQTYELSEGHGQIITASHLLSEYVEQLLSVYTNHSPTKSAGTEFQLGMRTVRTRHKNKSCTSKQ